jgi:hypothetical protein
MTFKTLISLSFGLTFAGIMSYHFQSAGLEVHLIVILVIFVLGMLFGRMFTVLMQRISKRVVAGISVETQPGEIIVKEGGANQFKGAEGVGGKLVLTDRRLIFRSHKLNIQGHQDSFNLAQISEVRATKILRIQDNGLMVRMAGEVSERFIVDEPVEWVNQILNQKARMG